MAKQRTQLDLVLPVREQGAPAIRWLYGALRQAILEGRLGAGARLPATRDLAEHYQLSRGTIVVAFEQLKSEGYLESRVGSGTYVARVLPDRLLQAKHTARPKQQKQNQPRRLSEFAGRVRAFREVPTRPVRAFRTDQPALDLFNTTLWTQVAARRLRRASRNLLQGCGPLGYRPLQEAVADYLIRSRGVTCVPEQVAIVSGTQEALDLAGRLFVNRGDRVAIENPGYVGAAAVFEALGAVLSPVRVDDEGVVLDGALAGARLLYVTPAHQFPLGVTMSISRRLALLEWAHKNSVMIFEDDYDSEYRYSGRPVPALQGLDRHGQVLFAGSFSKVLFPSLRLGYLVVPLDLVDVTAAAQSLTKRHGPIMDQAILADFIQDGHFGRHIRRMRQVYAERLGVLLECSDRHLQGLLDVSDVEAGLQTVGWLHAAVDDVAAARAAAQRDIEVVPLSRYTRGSPTRGGLQLGFAAVDARQIARGVRELAAALEPLARS
jgi:GntR family transcriptional regulator/MocR family aminotransferase